MNKKANFNVILIFIVGCFILLIAGLFLVIGSGIVNWVADETMPELRNIGMVGETNMTDIVRIAVTPVDTFIQSWTWLTGVLYVFGLLGLFGLAVAFRATGSNWLIGFFVGCVLLLVIAAIFVSILYEDFYDGNDDFALRLQEHKILSFLLLYSPVIFSIFAFMAGVILFGGIREEGGL